MFANGLIKMYNNLDTGLEGIEIYFTDKPAAEIRDALKAAGYRWHGVKKCWYAKHTAERLELAKSITRNTEGIAKELEAQRERAHENAENEKKKLSFDEKYYIIEDSEGWHGNLEPETKNLYGTELKNIIVKALKDEGFNASGRKERGGWTDSFTFTIKLTQDQTESEAAYIERCKKEVGRPFWYYTEDGESVHCDSLPEDYEERNRIITSHYRREYRANEGNPLPEVRRKIKTIVSAFNHNHSDIMTDYFDHGFYDWYKFKTA